MSRHLPITHNITLASKITILRILGVPAFILLLVYYSVNLEQGIEKDFQRWISLALFLTIALTDALDGYMARVRNEVTRLGTILDPIADKLLLLSALVLLTRPALPELQPQFPIFFTTLVISRDVFLFTGAWLINHITGRVDIKTRLPGKLATFMQMLAITWALSGGPAKPFVVIVWITGFFIVVSWVQYVIDGFKQMDHPQDKPA